MNIENINNTEVVLFSDSNFMKVDLPKFAFSNFVNIIQTAFIAKNAELFNKGFIAAGYPPTTPYSPQNHILYPFVTKTT